MPRARREPADFADTGLGYTTVGSSKRWRHRDPAQAGRPCPRQGTTFLLGAALGPDYRQGQRQLPYLEHVPAEPRTSSSFKPGGAPHAVRHGKPAGRIRRHHGLADRPWPCNCAGSAARIHWSVSILAGAPCPVRENGRRRPWIRRCRRGGADPRRDPGRVSYKDEPAVEPGPARTCRSTRRRLEPLDLMFRAAADRGRIVLGGPPSAWPERAHVRTRRRGRVPAARGVARRLLRRRR